MNKTLSLSAILTLVCAGAASAGVDLGWDDCLAGGVGGGGGTTTKSVSCTNSALSSPVLYMSFTVPAEVPKLGATDDRIIIVSPNTLGSWWLSGTNRFAAGLGPSTCPGWYDATVHGGVLFGPNIVQANATKLDIRTVISVATGEEPDALPGSEFLTHTLTIKFSATAPATFNNAECLAGAAIGAANLELQQPGALLPTELHQIPDVSNCVLWRSPTGLICPAATPTRKETWGAIKALYR